MSAAASDSGTTEVSLADLLRVLKLEDTGARTNEDIFIAGSHAMPNGRIYGGQVLAQCMLAAAHTIGDERSIHSMHGYFLRPGDVSAPLTLGVDRIHDGRSFSTRRTQAYQNGVPIFSAIASFQDSDYGLEHFEPMPEGIPQPEDLPREEVLLQNVPEAAARLLKSRPLDVRRVDKDGMIDPNAPRTTEQAVWMRADGALPDSPILHQAALAYLSDMSIQESVLRAHGLTWFTRGMRVASLDHAMWWHRPARVDEWLLYVHRSPSSKGGRGLAMGTIYTRDGLLVANVTQEIMVRVPQTSALADITAS